MGTFGLWHGFTNHFGDGFLDIKKLARDKNRIVNTPFGQMTASQFGNFLSGVTARNTGSFGTGGIILGGMFYDIIGSIFSSDPSESMWDGDRDWLGPLDADSRPDIQKGWSAAGSIGCSCSNR
jgi:hypothetical protein